MDSDQENKVNINTTRLTLRPVINSDELLLIQLLMDKKVRKHLGGPISKEMAEKRFI